MVAGTDAQEAGLVGPVRTVFTRGNPFWETEYYDRTGKLMERWAEVDPNRFRDGQDRLLKWIHSYDEKGNRTLVTLTDRDGSPISVTAFAYDEDGNQTASVTADMKPDRLGQFDIAELRHYNGEGRERLRLLFMGHESVRKKVFEYDEEGKRVEETSLEDEQVSFRMINKYDSMGNLVERLYYDAQGVLEGKEVSEYDERGNRIRESHYDVDGSLRSQFSSRYEFDERGNWVKRIDTTDVNPLNAEGQPTYIPGSVTTRTVSYYDD